MQTSLALSLTCIWIIYTKTKNHGMTPQSTLTCQTVIVIFMTKSGNCLWNHLTVLHKGSPVTANRCKQKITDRPEYQPWQLIISCQRCVHLQRVTSKSGSSEMTRVVAAIWRWASLPEGTVCSAVSLHRPSTTLRYAVCYYDASAVSGSTMGKENHFIV